MDYFEFFITDNKSGWKCQKKKLKNKHPDLFNKILDYIEQNKELINLPFAQQIYHFIFNQPSIPACIECGKTTTKFLDIRRGYQKFCSKKCSNSNNEKIEKIKQTNLNVYGVTNPMLNSEIKKNIEEKNQETFGCVNPFLSKTIQQQIKETNIKKYKNAVPSKTEGCKEKYKKTCNERYGYDSHWKNPEFRGRVDKTIEEKFGVKNVFQNDDIKEKIKNKIKLQYGVDNPSQCVKIVEKMIHTRKRRLIKKYGVDCIFKVPEIRKKYLNKTSKIEKKICEEIGGTLKFYYGGKEYDIIKGNNIYEIDGDFFHPKTLENLTITQLSNSINDYEKINLIKDSEYTLHKIHLSSLPMEFTENDLQKISYTPDYSIDPFKKIMTKEYLSSYIETHGKEKLSKYLNVLLKFIRTFHPQFPYVVYRENLPETITKIHNYDLSKTYNPDNKSFYNNCSRLGCGYLKNNFPSFWKSSYKTNISPIDIWKDDNIMRRIIAYRIGINDSGEVFDFSIKELIKGISAIRGTVSFFKPIVAGAIYSHYLNNKIDPVVFDPCAGFGGRLLGFKSRYPNGTYIGVESNLETYNELVNLGNHFTFVNLYNQKIEDFTEINDYDIAFTSIPYYNLETYSNNNEYESFEAWEKTFVNKIIKYPKLIINMTESLAEKLNLTEYIDTYLINQASHFQSNKKMKREVILKMNF